MDFKNIYEIFSALVDENEIENCNKEEEGDNKEPWWDTERKLALVTLVILVAVCVWYLSIINGSTPGLDLSQFNRILPESPEIPTSNDTNINAGKPSLLEENYNVKIVAWEARQEEIAAAQAAELNSNSVEADSIQSRHW